MMIERIRPWVQGKGPDPWIWQRGKIYLECTEKLDCCSFVDVADMAEPKEKPEGIRNWIAGPDYQKCLNEYDVVFKRSWRCIRKAGSVLFQSDPVPDRTVFPVFQGSDHRNYRHKGKKYDHNPDLSSVKGSWDGYDPGRKYRYSCV